MFVCLFASTISYNIEGFRGLSCLFWTVELITFVSKSVEHDFYISCSKSHVESEIVHLPEDLVLDKVLPISDML